MSAPATAVAAQQWPVDVLEFALKHQVQAYLDPLHEALQRLFPTARSLKVYLEDDPEIRDDRHIVFDLNVPWQDVPDYVAAKRRWHENLYRHCPAPLVCIFRLCLELADA